MPTTGPPRLLRALRFRRQSSRPRAIGSEPSRHGDEMPLPSLLFVRPNASSCSTSLCCIWALLRTFPDWSVGRGAYNRGEPAVNPESALDSVCRGELPSNAFPTDGSVSCGNDPSQGARRRGERRVAFQVHEKTRLVELYAQMCLIRAFEQRVSSLYRTAEIPGFIHTSLGQEAVAVGVCAALRDDDWIATTHRGHGHCLAKGADVEAAMAELFGKATGLCKGKGGSMHIADPRKGILGANAIVGASLPLATGAALSSRLLGGDGVAVAFFGEGAVNQGTFHESVNLAAVWDLPVLFVCENNRYA